MNPPRAVYIDYPLGHTSGKPNDKAGQRRILLGALRALESAQQPGVIVDLNERWSDDASWKDRVMRPEPKSAHSEANAQAADAGSADHKDDRVLRYTTPQYQNDDDALAADAACPSCIWLEQAQT